MRSQPVSPILAAATAVALILLWCCTVSESLAGEYPTPEALALPRRQISLKDNDLRLFNALGSLTFRERTVTGIAGLFIAPRAASRAGRATSLASTRGQLVAFPPLRATACEILSETKYYPKECWKPNSTSAIL